MNGRETAYMQLPGLVERVAGELRGRGLLGAQKDGRVADAPDARTIRYYQTLGLVDRPLASGREVRYTARHALQVVAIKALQARGVPLAEVQRRLYGRSDAELAAVVGEAPAGGVAAASSAAASSAAASSTAASSTAASSVAAPVATPPVATPPIAAPPAASVPVTPTPVAAAPAAPMPRLDHQVAVALAPGVRLVLDAGVAPPADTEGVQRMFVAALAAWRQVAAVVPVPGSRPAGEGGS